MTTIRQVKKFAITLSAQRFTNNSDAGNKLAKQLPANNKEATEGSVRFMKKTVKKCNQQALSDYTIF